MLVPFPPAAANRLLLSALSTVIAWRDSTYGVNSARCAEQEASTLELYGSFAKISGAVQYGVPTCEREQQHLVVLVRNKGPYIRTA